MDLFVDYEIIFYSDCQKISYIVSLLRSMQRPWKELGGGRDMELPMLKGRKLKVMFSFLICAT